MCLVRGVPALPGMVGSDAWGNKKEFSGGWELRSFHSNLGSRRLGLSRTCTYTRITAAATAAAAAARKEERETQRQKPEITRCT